MTQFPDNHDMDQLLEHLHQKRGFDFSGYKRTTLNRRIHKRMQDVSIDNVVDYTDYLEVHPEEFTELFNTVLINVTDFFRDSQAWDYLKNEIIPKIIDTTRQGAPIRVWSAGCASGEEAYSL
jgi:two-component system, chemotaxis family, CheB/CheR fusion protein